MNRKELYAKIKELNLQDKIMQLYGSNYTRVSNSKLEKVIEEHNEVKNALCVETKVSACNKCDKLIEVLSKKHILLKSEVIYINS